MNHKQQLLVCALITAILTAFITYAATATWYRDSSFTISCDSKNVPDAKVYRHGLNDLLVTTTFRDSPDTFIIHLRQFDSSVSLSPRGYWLMFTKLFALPRDNPPWEADMRGSKGCECDPKLVIRQKTISFTDEQGRLISLETTKDSVWH